MRSVLLRLPQRGTTGSPLRGPLSVRWGMSAPVEYSAPRDWMPTTVHSSSTAGAKGRSCCSIASERRSIVSSRRSMCARIAPTQSAWCASKWPSSASWTAESSCASGDARGPRAPAGRWCRRPARRACRAPRFAHDVRRDAVQRDPGVLERLVQAIDLAGAFPGSASCDRARGLDHKRIWQSCSQHSPERASAKRTGQLPVPDGEGGEAAELALAASSFGCPWLLSAAPTRRSPPGPRPSARRSWVARG